MQAALKALGANPDQLSVILIQMVSLLRDGKPVAMGKREGEFVTLDAVVDEVGRDATRFFYLMRRHDTPLEFDLELGEAAVDGQSRLLRPIRACALRLAAAACARAGSTAFRRYTRLLRALALPEEIALLRRLSDFPDFLADAAAAREPHRLVQYIQEVASDFQSYYTRLQKVYGDSILPQQRQRVGDWRANLGLEADGRASGLGRGHPPGAGNRAVLAGRFRPAGNEARWKWPKRPRKAPNSIHRPISPRRMPWDTLQELRWKIEACVTSNVGATRSRCASTTARSFFCSSAAPWWPVCFSFWA
jgi:hypothetical protein